MQRQSRTTKQRMVILEELRAVCCHPTADELYSMTRARLPRISLGTVYRNLDLLARQGEIICLESAGSQKRFDGNTKDHHHVRCVHCGKVGDIPPSFGIAHIPDKPVEGFIITKARLEFEGVCVDCAADDFAVAS